MQKHFLLVVAAAFLTGSGIAQQNSSTPQTARQALIEMFFSKTPGTFMKHLPVVTREALEKSGAMANMQPYSLLTSQLEAQGKSFETFDTGSILLSAADPKSGEKAEVTVESDSLQGGQDDIELSFQTYKNGSAQMTPFKPKFIFSMKQEANVWKLNEISFMIHLPLADPDFLKAMTEKMKPSVNAGATFTPHSQTATQAGGTDAVVVAAMRSILTAEVTYAASYPSTGYTCTLSDLDGFGGGQPNEHQAMLINSGLASGKRFGFVFTLSDCGRSPASSFHLVAAPGPNTFGRKTFCADQSGVIRSSDTPVTCAVSGVSVQ